MIFKDLKIFGGFFMIVQNFLKITSIKISKAYFEENVAGAAGFGGGEPRFSRVRRNEMRKLNHLKNA